MVPWAHNLNVLKTFIWGPRYSRVASGGVLQKKLSLKHSWYLHKNTPATLLKKDSNTGVLLWKFWNQYNAYFEEHRRTAASWCHINAVLFRSFIHSTYMKVSVEEYISSGLKVNFQHERCSWKFCRKKIDVL